MNKKTYSFRFSDEVIKQLDKISKQFGNNRTKAVEKMINDRYTFYYDKNTKPVVKLFDNILKGLDQEKDKLNRSLKKRKRQTK
jgi:predicted DNA-binding protein